MRFDRADQTLYAPQNKTQTQSVHKYILWLRWMFLPRCSFQTRRGIRRNRGATPAISALHELVLLRVATRSAVMTNK
jgi:hypothetical protein